MADPNIPESGTDDKPFVPITPIGINLSAEGRVWQLERLVLFMTKFIVADGPNSPLGRDIASIIEDLKARHPDV